MFITRKHLSRRTVLKGAGVSLALPFLDAMVPASTALAQTACGTEAARWLLSTSPHGAIMGNTTHGPSMDRWTPSGSGANFKLSPILSSLEPYKKYVSSFGNLENAASAGSVHTLNPATWAQRHPYRIPAVLACAHGGDAGSGDRQSHKPGHASAVARTCLGKHRADCGGRRKALRQYDLVLPCDPESPLPMEYNPRKVFLQLPSARAIRHRSGAAINSPIEQHSRFDSRSHQEAAGRTGRSPDRAALDGYLESGSRNRAAHAEKWRARRTWAISRFRTLR